MTGRIGLGEFEHLVLLVVLRLGDRAFGPDIATELEKTGRRPVTRGALYSTLNRLEDKRLLAWVAESPTQVRSGHIRRIFSVTRDGLAELRERRDTLRALWSGLDAVLEGGRR